MTGRPDGSKNHSHSVFKQRVKITLSLYLHCPIFRKDCKGSSSRLCSHTSLSSLTSIVSLACRRVARIWKRGGGGFFQRLRKVQTTLTRIFIVLESVNPKMRRNFSESSEIETFFRPKTGGLQKKKGLHRN